MQSGYQDNLTDFQNLKNVSINIADYRINNTGFCLGSASVPRELILSTQVNALEDHSALRLCMDTGLGDKVHPFQEKNCGQLDTV